MYRRCQFFRLICCSIIPFGRADVFRTCKAWYSLWPFSYTPVAHLWSRFHIGIISWGLLLTLKHVVTYRLGGVMWLKKNKTDKLAIGRDFSLSKSVVIALYTRYATTSVHWHDVMHRLFVPFSYVVLWVIFFTKYRESSCL